MQDNLLALIVLAILQGVVEVLPISSTGHLALAQELFSLHALTLPLAAALHAGSFFAIAFVFRRDLCWLLNNLHAWRHKPGWRRLFSRPDERHVPFYIALSLVPIVLAGPRLQSQAEEIFSQGLWVSTFLALNGLILWAVARWTRGGRMLKELAWWEFLLIGTTQVIAVLPGISRLGLALCVGLCLRLNWYEALRLSFILALPTILGAIVLQAGDIWHSFAGSYGLLGFSLLTVPLTAVFSWVGLRFLASSLLERRTLNFFGCYCIFTSSFTFAYLASGL